MVDLLKKLTEANGVSGDEGQVRDIIKEEILPYVDKVYIDGIGNLIAYKKGTSDNAKKLMLCAHMDEVGFIISGFSDDGMLKFKTVGGIDPRVMVSKRVVIGEDRHPGVLGIKAIHLQEAGERNKAVKVKQMYIDVGATSVEEAKKIVKLGDYATFDTTFSPIGENRVKAKALDDRVGCAVLMEILKETYACDIYACFTVQEEVGLRGAGVAAYHVAPDMALVIEGTTCSDVPGVDGHMYSTIMGEGPAISMMDGTSIIKSDMVNRLIELAKDNDISFQIKKGATGGNDAGRIHLSREGVKTAVISVPCRYIHSPVSVLDLDDLNNTVRLVKQFAKGCE